MGYETGVTDAKNKLFWLFCTIIEKFLNCLKWTFSLSKRITTIVVC